MSLIVAWKEIIIFICIQLTYDQYFFSYKLGATQVPSRTTKVLAITTR